MLPHRFPLRLIDRREGEEILVRVSTGAAWARGAAGIPGSLALEILAQAALLLLGEGAHGHAYLAGLDDARFARWLGAGDDLMATARLAGRVGAMVKVEARLERGGEEVARADLWLGLKEGEEDGKS